MLHIVLHERNYLGPARFRTMLSRTDILGVPVNTLDMPRAVAEVAGLIGSGHSRYGCAADMHSIMQAQRNPLHMTALREAHMVIPDGTPLVWAAKAQGNSTMHRVCGPDIMLELCSYGVERGWRHYFYGGAEGVAEELALQLQRRFPGLRVAGTQSPPFRKLTSEEQEHSLALVTAARPDIVWVGLGCPKQEIWMREHAEKLQGPVVIGVGAAFDFHSNRIARAPLWMRRMGLEWLHRLASEPARLWRRYLLLGPEFLLRAGVQSLRMRLSADGRVAD